MEKKEKNMLVLGMVGDQIDQVSLFLKHSFYQLRQIVKIVTPIQEGRKHVKLEFVE